MEWYLGSSRPFGGMKVVTVCLKLYFKTNGFYGFILGRLDRFLDVCCGDAITRGNETEDGIQTPKVNCSYNSVGIGAMTI